MTPALAAHSLKGDADACHRCQTIPVVARLVDVLLRYHVRRAGWHPFWDRLWSIFNPDSELIRDGGFEEPEYTDFIPPADFRFQCPQCGARQPFDYGVCWLCGYGADGDETAYRERWGDIDPQ